MIIEPRIEEILNLAKIEVMQNTSQSSFATGAVLTGGSMMMKGTVELAEKILGMPVRLGIPMEVGGLKDIIGNPIYSTGVGLVQYGLDNNENKKIRIRDENIFRTVLDSMKNWFHEFF